jgi:hypothetical protein
MFMVLTRSAVIKYFELWLCCFEKWFCFISHTCSKWPVIRDFKAFHAAFDVHLFFSVYFEEIESSTLGILPILEIYAVTTMYTHKIIHVCVRACVCVCVGEWVRVCVHDSHESIPVNHYHAITFCFYISFIKWQGKIWRWLTDPWLSQWPCMKQYSTDDVLTCAVGQSGKRDGNRTDYYLTISSARFEMAIARGLLPNNQKFTVQLPLCGLFLAPCLLNSCSVTSRNTIILQLPWQGFTHSQLSKDRPKFSVLSINLNGYVRYSSVKSINYFPDKVSLAAK